jgi:hypothetical protein
VTLLSFFFLQLLEGEVVKFGIRQMRIILWVQCEVHRFLHHFFTLQTSLMYRSVWQQSIQKMRDLDATIREPLSKSELHSGACFSSPFGTEH